MEGQVTRGGVEDCDCLATDVVEGAGVDDAFAFDPLVAGGVGVAMKDVIHFESAYRPIEAALVAVEHGKGFAVELEPDRRFGWGDDPDGFQIRQQPTVGEVHVPPYEAYPPSGKFVEHSLPTNVAAMNDLRHAKLVE